MEIKLTDFKIDVQNFAGKFEEVTIVPTTEKQEILPSEKMDAISKVTVEAVNPSDYYRDEEVCKVTPSESEQNILPSENKVFGSVKVAPIPSEYVVPSGEVDITENGTHNVAGKASANVNVKPKLQDKTITANGTFEADEGFDGFGKVDVNVVNNTDKLQWKCDNLKSLAYEFNKCQLDNVDECLNGLDTSQVEDFNNMFYESKITKAPSINYSNGKNCLAIFSLCREMTDVSSLHITNKATTIRNLLYYTKVTSIPNDWDTSNVTDITYTFSNSQIETIPQMDFGNVLEAANAFNYCTNLKSLPYLNMGKCKQMSYFAANNKFLETIEGIDLASATSLSSIVNGCPKLTNLVLKNIKTNLQIGSGTTYGHLLTVDSLVGIIQELRNVNTARTLTVGSANLEKLANVYVKLVDITDEMRAEDEFIDQKLPFVVCESTDEGALHIINDYASLLKNWAIT